MSDCPNVEMREFLPELINGRLDAASEARVREHIALCADCAAELELLERVRRAYSAGPAIDTAVIVRALPSPRSRRAWSRTPLRIAAAIVLLLGGALVMRTLVSGPQNPVDSMIVRLPVDSLPVTAVPESTTTNPPRGLAMSLSELDDLDVEELETLLGALDRIDAAPAAEPDTLIGSVPSVGS